jgi:hypothetical protein
MNRPALNTEELKLALDAAEAGDVIQLQAGVTYFGPFTLKPKSGKVSVVSSTPLPEGRVRRSDAGLMPRLESATNWPVIEAQEGVGNYVFENIHFAQGPGDSELIVLHGAGSFTFTRCLILGSPAVGALRGIRANCRAAFVAHQCYVGDVFRPGQESQGICAWDGKGPYTITDCHVEAASINVLFGGSDSSSQEQVPQDIRVEGNTLRKNLEWVGKGYAIKNCLEFKSALRFSVLNNLLENSWSDAQGGILFLINTHNDDGGSPWAAVRDGLVKGNILRNAPDAFGLAGRDPYHTSGQSSNITIDDNECQLITRKFMNISDDFGTVMVRRNKCDNPSYALHMWGPEYAVRELTWDNPDLKNQQIAGDAVSFSDALKRYVYMFNGVLTGGATPLCENEYPAGESGVCAVCGHPKSSHKVAPEPPPPSGDVEAVKQELEAAKLEIEALQNQATALQQGLSSAEGRIAQQRSYIANVPQGNSAQNLAKYLKNMPG